MTTAGILTMDVVPNLAGFAAKLTEARRPAAAQAQGDLSLSKTSKAVQDIGLGVAALGVGIAAGREDGHRLPVLADHPGDRGG